MAIIKNPEYRKKEINLLGKEGNAYNLLAYASTFGKQLDLDVDKITGEMKSSNYENLIKVFDKYFGSIVDLVYRS